MLKRIMFVIGLLVAAGITAVVTKMGPRNIIGMIQYDQRKEGDLKVGDRAPDTSLVSLDGKNQNLLRVNENKPMVLVFGSFT